MVLRFDYHATDDRNNPKTVNKTVNRTVNNNSNHHQHQQQDCISVPNQLPPETARLHQTPRACVYLHIPKV